MKNLAELREQLALNIKQLRSGELDRKAADSITNACGKILASLRDELAYYRDRDEEPTIEFLNSPGSSGKKKTIAPAAVPRAAD